MSTMITEEIKDRWKPLLEDANAPKIDSAHKRFVTTRLLENTRLELLKETSNNTTNVDNIDPVLMTLVRRTAPNLMAFNLCGVQPMSGPTGTIFALRAHYGVGPEGPFGRPGDARTGFQTGSAVDSFGRTVAQDWGFDGKAPNEAFKNEADTTYSGKSNTYSSTGGAGTAYSSAYTIGSGIATTAGEFLGRGGTNDGDFAEMSFTIDKTSVEAQTRALKAEYSMELAQDLRQVHGLDAESELANILSTELVAEINREIIQTIRRVAKIAPASPKYSNGAVVTDSSGDVVYGMAGLFDINVNSDGRWSAEKYKSLLVKINKEANAIAKDTRRGRGNVLIVSSDVASVLDLTGKMVYSPAIDNNLNVDDTGNTFVGVLQGRFQVYIDPYLTYDEVIVGYRGANAYDAGFFYCPYVPLQMVRAIGENTFQPKMAFKTRYGIVANPFTTIATNANLYYRKFKVTL
jgi:hypothetical protein